MLDVLGSIVGGFFVGSTINCLREGVRFRPFHSKKARAEFEPTRRKIRKKVKSIYWTEDDLDPKWYDR